MRSWEEFQEARERERASQNRITWRRCVFNDRLEGWSGKGRGRELVYALRLGQSWEYGQIAGQRREPAGSAGNLALARAAAARLLQQVAA